MKQLSALIIFLVLAQNLPSQPSEIDTFIKSYAKEHQFSGTVLIRQGGKNIYHKNFGLANLQFKVPVNNQTKFKIASITKLFTAVLIMRLYEQGEIDLHKTIKTYLPNYTGEGAEKVTIHQLLNHTSGMRNIDTLTSQESAIQFGVAHYQHPYTTDELLTKFCSVPLEHEPGKVFSYNNGEYIILGKIIEALYGKSYEVVLNEQILQPLNLKNTGLLYQRSILSNLADTYFIRNDIDVLANDLPVYIENWYAAGAMYSTADDVMLFSNALFNHRLLKKETVALMLKPGLDGYGYSVWSYEVNANSKRYRAVKRPGSIMGAQAVLFHFPDEALTIIILANTDAASMDDFCYRIGIQLLK